MQSATTLQDVKARVLEVLAASSVLGPGSAARVQGERWNASLCVMSVTTSLTLQCHAGLACLPSSSGVCVF